MNRRGFLGAFGIGAAIAASVRNDPEPEPTFDVKARSRYGPEIAATDKLGIRINGNIHRVRVKIEAQPFRRETK